MSEAVQLAKAAREQLALALNALQTDAQVPEDLLDVAEPIAQAMGVLHRVERSGGANLEGRDVALASVRAALAQTQKVTTPHPAIDIVMEAVATSLSKVHALSRFTPAPAAPQPAAAPQPVAQAFAAPADHHAATMPAHQSPYAGGPPQASPVGYAGYAPQAQPAQGFAPQQAQPAKAYAPQPAPAQAYAPQPAPAQAYAPQPAPAQGYAPQPAAPQPQAYAPQQVQRAPQPQPAAAPAQPQAAAAPPPAGTIDVELGTHSPSTFYKGLGGNDIIEAGGVFVATYKVPKIGSKVSLRVLMPGNYEFTANATVQWTREASGEGAEPGFGAKFTQITAEGRQLVYRYTRNREPMFYDDL